jgi:hypothetical protein
LELRHGFSGPHPQGWYLFATYFLLFLPFKCCGSDFDEEDVIEAICSRSMASLTDLPLSKPASDKFLNDLAYKSTLNSLSPLPILRYSDNCDTSIGTL